MAFTFPDPNVTPEFTGPNAITYSWDDNDKKWVVKTTGADGLYVKKAGDTMTGALVMDDAGEIEMKDTTLDFVRRGESLKDGNGDPILEDDGQGNMVEQWDDNNERFSHIESLPPRLIKSDGTSGGDTKTPFGIRVEIDDGNTWKNQFKVGNRNGDVVTIQGGTGPNIVLGDFARKDGAQHGIDNGVLIKNIPTPDRELTPGDYAVNKEYVDKEDEILLNGLIDLQEEIDAIAPSLEKGAWEWDPNTNIAQEPGEGKFYLLSGTYPSWSITDEYSQADAVVFNRKDAGGTDHTNWDSILGDPNNPDTNKLILLFDKPDPDKCLGKITNIRDIGETNNPFTNSVYVEFARTEGFGKPNNAQDDDGKYITYVNIFTEPSGGTASDFVLKIGDEMTGELNIRTEQPNGDANYTKPGLKDKHLRLSTTRTDTNSTRHAYLFQPGYSENLMSSGHIISGNYFYSKGGFLGYSTSGGDNFKTFSPRLHLTDTYGGLYYNNANLDGRRVYLTHSNGYLYYDGKYAAKWNQDGFYAYYQDSERFKTTQFGTYFTQPIYVYHTTIKAQNSAGDSSSGTYGVAGQVLTSQGSNPPRWKDVSGQFGRRFKYSSQTSGTPNQGYFCFHTGRLWINETDLEGIEYRHTIGDYKWDVPFYVFSTSSQHTLMASMLTTGSDYSSAGYTKYISNGWNHTSLTHGATYYCRLTGLW